MAGDGLPIKRKLLSLFVTVDKYAVSETATIHTQALCTRRQDDKVLVDTFDIRERINTDFGDKASDVIRIFDEAISKADYLNQDRIIRCVIYLSDKDLNKLKKNIETATYDPRDVMLWAEYKNRGQGEMDEVKRIRDFNKPFDQADKDVRE
jgi:hypothetical protein